MNQEVRNIGIQAVLNLCLNKIHQTESCESCNHVINQTNMS